MSGYDSSQEQWNMMFLSVKYWQARGRNATVHHHLPYDNSANQPWQPVPNDQIENFSFPEVSLRSLASLGLFEILRACVWNAHYCLCGDPKLRATLT